MWNEAEAPIHVFYYRVTGLGFIGNHDLLLHTGDPIAKNHTVGGSMLCMCEAMDLIPGMAKTKKK